MNFVSLNLAYKSLLRQKKRSILTMLAISIGISAVITIMAAGAGMEKLVLGQLDSFDPNTISIETKIPSTKRNSSENAFGQASGVIITSLKDKDLETIKNYPNITAVYGMVTGQEAVSYGGEIKKIMIWGEGADVTEVEQVKLSSGRFFSNEEEDSLSSVAVLGSTAAEKLFGEDNGVGKNIYIRGKPFRVIGVMEPRGSAFFFDMDNIIYLPTKTMQKKLLGIDYVQQIIAKMKDGTKADSTVADLTQLLRDNHSISDPNRDDFTINTMIEARESLNTVTEGITLLLVALVCISLLVGGVGIMNIMYVSVAERTFEIGLRKSLGAKRRDVLWQFLTEAILITLGGGVVGIILGSLVALLIYFLATSFGLSWVYEISLSSILLAVGFSAGIGLLFGIYPARRAAALNPIDALRKE